jgi:signal transduction histidine kinase
VTRLKSRMSHEGRPGGRPHGPPEDEGLVFAIPSFRRPPGGPPEPWQGLRELGWVIVELNAEYLKDTVLPDLVQHHLGGGGAADYAVEVVNRFAPSSLVWESQPGQAKYIAASADASVNLLDLQYDQIMGRPGLPGMRERRPPREAGEDQGRWQMLVRHRAGSLEAAVARARRGNLAITGAILLLIMATAAALVRFTRNAQNLAALQMEFVAGVSHELRTPLSVLRTAGYNLRGKVAGNPAQVERYGALIQQESERLTALVEQVLRFAGAQAGRVIQKPEPVSVEAVIDESLASSRSAIEDAHCAVEKSVDAALPVVLGDATALKHALQNLLANAARYGAQGGSWIGVSAAALDGNGRREIEIRVTDRGPGIPGEEQGRIFEPFFRGRRAVAEQVHGTGLGLNLVKRIVEAHGGSIAVYSEPAKGAEFVIRIPAAPPEYQHELTHPVSRG